MAWDELELNNSNNESLDKAKEKAINEAKAFHQCFKTEAGQKVLAYLTNNYIMNNKPEKSAPNITYEAGFCNGQADVVTHIMALIQRAEIL